MNSIHQTAAIFAYLLIAYQAFCLSFGKYCAHFGCVFSTMTFLKVEVSSIASHALSFIHEDTKKAIQIQVIVILIEVRAPDLFEETLLRLNQGTYKKEQILQHLAHYQISSEYSYYSLNALFILCYIDC